MEKQNKIRFYGRLFFVIACVGAVGVSCSHPEVLQPYDSVTVDRSNPERTVIVLNGSCTNDGAKKKDTAKATNDAPVTENGKTYYFSTAADRDRFLETYMANSRY